MESLQSVLMHRDDMTAQEACETIDDLRKRVMGGENPEELLLDELGLEPDYIFDIM